MDLNFKIQATSQGTKARACTFNTLHGKIETPLFMPVGTQASVRNVRPELLKNSGSQILLANTYHLFLRPGIQVFEKFGGIHRFMNWPGSVLTDSGGFQVFSLPKNRKITEEGVLFESYVDGSKHLLSPESSIAIQKTIGADIMMAMDLCIESTSDFSSTQKAMEQTHRWAIRSLEAKGSTQQGLFGIIQGATHEKLRVESAKFISSLPFDGLAIGGLAVGETKAEREHFTNVVTDVLPPMRPRYLMGVGTPIDLLEAVHRGVDMFDCIIPTKLAEQGVAYTSKGKIQLLRGVYKFSEEALDPDCLCEACQKYSRAYLHHLAKTCEPLSTQLLGAHNIYFYHKLMRQIRSSILNGTFLSFYNEWQQKLEDKDTHHNIIQPKVGRRPDRRPQSLGNFELHRGSPEFYSIKHSSSGEVMHPGTNPMIEAKTLYIEQSQLKEKLHNLTPNEEFVVWDVGLGAAFNAMAAIDAYKIAESKGILKIFSFENDLDALRLALFHPAYFPHLKHGAPHELIDEKLYKTENLEWHLIEGDFCTTFERAPCPDLIFFDPFSSKTDHPLWSLMFFKKLNQKLKLKPALLINYTASTLIRARMLLSGFFVATGVATPPKEETTLALTQPTKDYKLLDTRWIERLDRSEVKKQLELEIDGLNLLDQVKRHPQFALHT